MPRPPSHPCELFTLIPLNDCARRVVNDPYNSHLLTPVPNGELGIYIGHVRSNTHGVLATMGRDGDILVQGNTIGRRHCSFDISSGGVIMLHDHSRYHSTQVSGECAMPFEMARTPRRVIVTREVNTILGMGGLRSDLIQFRLLWHVQDSTGITEKDGVWEPDHEGRENPRLARTVDEAPTILPSRRMTRVHTPGEHSLPVRYIKGRQLGSGQFGTVYKAVDVDSATTMAVKTIQRPQCGWKIDSWNQMKREVETLARISHVIDSSPVFFLPLLTMQQATHH